MKLTAALAALALAFAMAAFAVGVGAPGVASAQVSDPNARDEDAPRAPVRPQRRMPRDTNAGPCPLMGVLYDSQRIVQFKGAEERFSEIAWTGEIRGVRGLCRYRGEQPIVMNLDIDMAFGRGPAAEGETYTYRYWVAVTRRDTAAITRQVFEKTVRFERGVERVVGVEPVERIVIPRANGDTSGANFEILVGFELTPQQLAFNRDGKRFRIDVGQ